MDDNLIQQALNAQTKVPPAEWLMVGFTCNIGDIELGGQKMKAMVFYHASNPDGVRFIFPMNETGARAIGNELLGKPSIVVPDYPPQNGSI
jgi:hypothetical protein